MKNKTSLIYEFKIFPEKKKRKQEKRIRKSKTLSGEKKHINRIRDAQIKSDRNVLPRYNYKLRDYFVSKNFIQFNFNETDLIIIPPVFSLIKNFRISFEILTLLVGLLEKEEEKYIRLDFSICKEVDFSALFPLRILLTDYNEHCLKIQKLLQRIDIMPQIFCIPSKEQKVNSYLINSKFLYNKNSEDNTEIISLHSLGFYKGDKTQNKFTENKKSIASSKVVGYVNKCLIEHQHELNPEGTNDLEGIISEILNNCEDHSPHNTWYLSANFLRTNNKENPKEIVSELNIAILNFGFSIYEGFEETKDNNIDVYNQMDKLANNIILEYNSMYEKKDLFTLYALQEGVSRLKYKNESRGTGTIKFINSFLEFGDYESNDRGLHPQLSIISGSTCIICDNKFKPKLINDLYIIALNSNNTLKEPPADTHLKRLPLYFPGTIIGVKVYINEEHLQSKLQKDEDIRN